MPTVRYSTSWLVLLDLEPGTRLLEVSADDGARAKAEELKTAGPLAVLKTVVDEGST